jgi:hypothetical protein
MPRRLVLLLAAAALICVSAGAAKDFKPGGLRVCSATRCVPVMDRVVLRTFTAFFYGDSPVAIAQAPRRGAPAFQLRYRDGYLAGVIGGLRLDRIAVNGLNCGRFRHRVWYRLPARVVLEVRRLAAPLEPLRINRASVPGSC